MRISFILTVLLIVVPATAQAGDPVPSDEQILSWLAELEPLPKVHYSWPVPLGRVPQELLYEYVWLPHAVSLSGEWSKPEQIDQAVAVCKRVNSNAPETPASIGINYSVWHRRFGKDLPPTDTGPTRSTIHRVVSRGLQCGACAMAELEPTGLFSFVTADDFAYFIAIKFLNDAVRHGDRDAFCDVCCHCVCCCDAAVGDSACG